MKRPALYHHLISAIHRKCKKQIAPGETLYDRRNPRGGIDILYGNNELTIDFNNEEIRIVMFNGHFDQRDRGKGEIEEIISFYKPQLLKQTYYLGEPDISKDLFLELDDQHKVLDKKPFTIEELSDLWSNEFMKLPAAKINP